MTDLQDRAVALFQRRGGLTTNDLANMLKKSKVETVSLVRSMVATGRIAKVERGIYELCEAPEKQAPAEEPHKPFSAWNEDDLREAMLADAKGMPVEDKPNPPRAFEAIGHLVPDEPFDTAIMAALADTTTSTAARYLSLLAKAGYVVNTGWINYVSSTGNWSRVRTWEKVGDWE